MSSKITELMSKMSSVASGKSHLDNPRSLLSVQDKLCPI